jgi:hypothetical protein
MPFLSRGKSSSSAVKNVTINTWRPMAFQRVENSTRFPFSPVIINGWVTSAGKESREDLILA